MKAKSVLIWLVLLVFFAVSAACQLSPAAKPPLSGENNPVPTRVEAAENSQVSPGQPAEKATSDKPAGGLGAFRLDDFSFGLDTLNSYQQSLELGFDGTVNGTVTRSKTSLRRTVMRQPAAVMTWIEIDENPRQMFATLGDISYQQAGADGLCFAQFVEQQSGDAPAAFQLYTLPAVVGASAAGEERINDVPSTHYTFDESAIGRAGEGKAKGDLWVAKEGGYVVKYSLIIEGEGDQLGPGVTGTQRWEYQLTAPNAVSEPGLPEVCAVEQAEDIIPLPPGAADELRMPNFIQFQVALSPSQTAQFYKDQGAAMNWEEISSTPMQDSGQILNFRTVDGGMVSVRFNQQDGGTRVTLQTLQGKQ